MCGADGGRLRGKRPASPEEGGLRRRGFAGPGQASSFAKGLVAASGRSLKVSRIRHAPVQVALFLPQVAVCRGQPVIETESARD